MSSTTPVVAGEARSRPQELVLVVGDEESYRDALSIGLSQEGFDVVVVATDGAEARVVVRRDRPDLVLFDVMLPDISGMSCAARSARSATCR